MEGGSCISRTGACRGRFCTSDRAKPFAEPLVGGLLVKQKIAPVIDEKQWTTLEIAIWLSALIITITLGLLAVTGTVGSWAVVVPGAMGVIVALWRYRVETKRKKRTPED